jgi:predicted dehydrogenase
MEIGGHKVRIVKDYAQILDEELGGVVIANQTNLHLEYALSAARKKKNLFIEKPLSNSLLGIEDLAKEVALGGLIVEVGFMLRLHPNLVWIRSFLNKGGIGKIAYIRGAIGQWLPDWRPEVDYRTGYGAYKKYGGGVIFDLIHELDLCTWFGGEVEEISCMATSFNLLEIETEAIANINLKFKSGATGQLCLDYVRPVFRRNLEIVGNKGAITWDYSLGEVSVVLRGESQSKIVNKTDAAFERNKMFFDHMNGFLMRIKNPGMQPISSIQDGITTLKLALACHKSNEANSKAINLRALK